MSKIRLICSALHRAVTQRIGALADAYLSRDAHWDWSRLLWELSRLGLR